MVHNHCTFLNFINFSQIETIHSVQVLEDKQYFLNQTNNNIINTFQYDLLLFNNFFYDNKLKKNLDNKIKLKTDNFKKELKTFCKLKDNYYQFKKKNEKILFDLQTFIDIENYEKNDKEKKKLYL